ncbi:hypothetical protein AB0O01_01465 [Streptomyces sp. NPDC093252]|uniref:hypothetical protein n=1 Tax=Streptomyces sp. NPDC093252 TaxID=3154980 RepID=UPI00342F707B
MPSWCRALDPGTGRPGARPASRTGPGRAGHRRIDEAALAAGRLPSAVRRLYNLSPGPDGFPRGPLDTRPEQLAALAPEHGTSAFLLPPGRPGLLEGFAAEVAPATRELLAAERIRGRPRRPRSDLGAPVFRPAR